jgi:hypothetical protein
MSEQATLCPGYRHIGRGIDTRYSSSVKVRTYPSGERRISAPPPKETVEAAFAELGTEAGVAAAFGVSRATVKHWVEGQGIIVKSRPEAALASYMRRILVKEVDKCKVAQWIMDEGSVSVAYFSKGDYTLLLVCGSMNDYAVLSSISKILETTISSSKAPGPTTLPMVAVRVQSARAYTLLEIVMPYLTGLKRREAQVALNVFPHTGMLRGRHTTDEFFLDVWKEFAVDVLSEWNKKRKVKTNERELLERAQKWVEGRVKRARRFRDAHPKDTVYA